MRTIVKFGADESSSGLLDDLSSLNFSSNVPAGPSHPPGYTGGATSMGAMGGGFAAFGAAPVSQTSIGGTGPQLGLGSGPSGTPKPMGGGALARPAFHGLVSFGSSSPGFAFSQFNNDLALKNLQFVD